jgi:TonB family protein
MVIRRRANREVMAGRKITNCAAERWIAHGPGACDEVDSPRKKGEIMKSLIAALALLPMAAWGQTPPPDGIPFDSSCAYPQEARAAQHEGTTLLSFEGTSGGRVEDVHVVQSSGHVDLDDAAVRCVAQWRFDPKTQAYNIGQRRTNISWALSKSPGAQASGLSIGVPHVCTAYYPEKERDEGIEGTTTLGFVITQAGRVGDLEVYKSSGNGNLDKAALYCAKLWRYRPAVKDGKPQAVAWKADVVWKISAPQIPNYAEPPHDCLKSAPVKASDLAGIDGVSEYEYTVVQGAVQNVSLVHSSGSGALDKAGSACIATRRYVREMVTVDGKDVDRFRTITLRARIVWADALKAGK